MYSCYIEALSAGTTGITKFSWRRESFLATSGSQKMDSCLVTERLSRPILRLRRSGYPENYGKSVGGNIQNDTLKSMFRRCNVSKM